MANKATKYRIVATSGPAFTTKNFCTTSDVQSAHTIADALRDTKHVVEVYLWTRKQRKILTERGARWGAGYVLTAI